MRSESAVGTMLQRVAGCWLHATQHDSRDALYLAGIKDALSWVLEDRMAGRLAAGIEERERQYEERLAGRIDGGNPG